MKSYKVLIPLDGSELSAQILATVKHFFAPDTSELILLQTIEEVKLPRQELPVNVALSVLVTPQSATETFRKTGSIQRYFDIEDNLIYQHQEELNKVAHTLQTEGFKVTVEVAVGNPSEMILERAKSGEFDMIAMATHGRSGLSRLLMGSIAEEVLHNAPIPVLLLRPTAV
ncbi:MAG: universal stress protein [Caldilineaceae bacterium]